MSSVDATFADPDGGRIYRMSQGNEIIDQQLNLTTLLKTSRDPVWGLNSKGFFFERDIAIDQYFSEPESRWGGRVR